MPWISRAFAAFCLLVVVLASAARANDVDRHALIIANSDYRPHSGLSPLPQARIDGSKIAELLGPRMHKFKVVHQENVQTKAAFQMRWDAFLADLGKGSAKQAVAIFYFSGHGAEVSNESYILPTEMLAAPQQAIAVAQPAEALKEQPAAAHLLDAHILNQGIKLKTLFEEFDKRVKALQVENDRTVHGIFIIDACRSPPPQGGTQKSVIDKSGARPVVPPPGIFVLYAASAGQVAHARFQGESEDTASVYTRHLLPLLEKPYSLQEIARLVRWEVHDAVAARMPKLPQTPQYFDDVATRRILTLNGLGTADNPEAQQELRSSTTKKKLTLDNVPEPGQQMWECPTCPRMVVVPKGTFKMGSRQNEAGNNATEEAKKDKYIDDKDRRLDVTFQRTFAIGIAEITVAQYRAYLANDGEKDCTLALHPACDPDLNPEKPVVGVSWRETQGYLDWLNTVKLKLSRDKPELGHYRLPTESEWEYAARGGAQGPFLVDSERELCEYGNGADQALHAVTMVNPYCNDRVGRGVALVQSYKPNGFGLYDVHGNALEWVADCWSDTLTDDKAAKEFRHGDLKDATCRRVARGGSWLSAPEALRLSKRVAYAPDHKRPTLGFRVMRVLPMKP